MQEAVIPVPIEIVEIATSTPVVIPQKELSRKEKILIYIKEASEKYNVSEDLLIYMAENESRFGQDVLGDTHLICIKTNVPQRSRGAMQINDCWHPEISDTKAFNDEFSIDWTAYRLSKGFCREWTTCRNYYNE